MVLVENSDGSGGGKGGDGVDGVVLDVVQWQL